MSKDRLVFNVHPGQKEVMHFKSRFKVIVAGRRWGKSKLAAVSLVQAAASRAKSLVWYVAPTYGMCKSIMWPDLIEIIPKKWIRKSNETIQFIELVNGSRIELKGCDKPDSLRGVGLHFLVIDEAQDIKKETWTTVLRPTLSDKQGGALIIGTPKGFNWLYDVYQEGQKPVNRKNGLWASWQFPTMTSPFIPPEEIEAAKRDMDEKVFNQEFNACHLPNTQVRLFDGTSKAISELKAGDKLNYLNDFGGLEEIKVLDGGYTGVKDVIEVTLENGETFSASYNHKVKNTELGQVQLKDVDCLEYTPLINNFSTREEKLAALVGYITGDGNITKRERQNGSVYYQGAVYSNVKEDMERILADLKSCGFCPNASITVKKNNGVRKDGYQIQFSHYDSQELVKLGTPFGPKTSQEFTVPEWILYGSNQVKKAYISALFGAEGDSPKFNAKSKTNHTIKMIMCKKQGFSGHKFFNQLQEMLQSLGVKATIDIKNNNGYETANLYSATSLESSIDFFEKVGYTYACQKSVKAWLAIHYYKCYKQKAAQRQKIVLEYLSGTKVVDLVSKYNISRQVIYNLIRTHKNKGIINSGHDFPSYQEWLANRWNQEKQILKLVVVKKELKPQQAVYNIKVSSSDSSYVLDSGLLNYNCFETMTGRVYFPFDRRIHTGSMYKFVPNKPIFVGMDFNVTPMTAVILQPQYNGELWAVDEIVLHNSSTTEMADEIERRYWRYMNQISIFPDPAANYRNSSRGETDIDILRQKGFKKIYFRKKHPAVQDRINAVNKMLKSADSTVRLFINDNCKHLIDSFEQTLYKENSKEVDKTQNKEHITDAIGYCIEYTNPVRSNIHIAMSI